MIIVVNQDNTASIFQDFNSLVDANETEIRAYLKQKDQYEIRKMKVERQELLNRIKGIEADLKGMGEDNFEVPQRDEQIF